MKKKYMFVTALLVAVTLVSSSLTALYLHQQKQGISQEKKLVVASFYPIYLAAKNVIADSDGVELQNLSEPQTGCLHDYQLTPEDMKLLSKADVFLVNGGGIENFLSDVAHQYKELTMVNTTEQLTLLEDNAHAWMSPTDYRQQVQCISEALAKEDPANAALYETNAEQYEKKIEALQAQIKELQQELAGEKVILFHEAFAYLADECGMSVAGVMDLDEERQISAGEVADVIRTIRKEEVPLILAEERYGKEMGDTVEKETEVHVCYLDPLTRGGEDMDFYLDTMQQNINQIKEAMTP